MQARIDLGHHHEILPSLTTLAAAEPLRERRWEQLMLALYRCDRRAEALNTFTRARTILVEGYGIDPGTALMQLHERILASDPSLDIKTSDVATLNAYCESRVSGPAVRSPDFPDRQPGTALAARDPLTVPDQLPPDVRWFVGRNAELSSLLRASPGCPGRAAFSPLALICGSPGVGKSTLALHFARQVAEQFPDGQLYINLEGFGPNRMLSPWQAIRNVLATLGAPRNLYRSSLDDRTSMYRRIVANQRMLIVIDNALNSAQVRSLLPAGSKSMVVVTSRRKLTGLVTSAGARLLMLDLLPPEDARKLLASRLAINGLHAENDMLAELSRSCGRLPLALTIAAARATARATMPLDHLLTELSDQRRQLDALHGLDPESDLRTVFSWSYEKLGRNAAWMFRFLGTYPSLNFTAGDIARAAGIADTHASRMLDELALESLITEPAPGQFCFHHLLHAYAAEMSALTNITAIQRHRPELMPFG